MSNGKRHFLDTFFYPKSVAVVGAARSPGTLNFQLLSNLVNLGFMGKIYPVNPNAEEILGLKSYPDLRSIEQEVDLAVIAVPASRTLDIVRDCVAKKVKCVTLVPGGFSEIGKQGKVLQDEILALLRQHGIRAIGPNALSPVNTSNNLVISFLQVEKLRQGNVSFIFQSGMYDPRLNWIFSDFHLDISKLIDLGNKMDVNEVDALEYLAEDPDTKIIAIHLETVRGKGREFVSLLKDASAKKPIVVLKSGRTAAGARAAASHTGSIAKESDAVFDTALRQAGVTRAQSLEEFFDFAKAFEFLNLPSSNKIVVATLPGGEGVIAADICQQEGFLMAKPSETTLRKARTVFPPWEIPLNPFDLGVCFQFHQTSKVYEVLLGCMVEDTNVDCLAIQVVAVGPASRLEDIYKPFLLAKEKGKPIAVWMPMTNSPWDVMVEKLESNRIPVYSSAERAIKALAVLYKYKVIRERPI